MVQIPTPNARAIGLSEDQRIRLRDLEQVSHHSEQEVGELFALRMCGTSEERVRADRCLDRARRESPANKPEPIDSDSGYKPGSLLGGTPEGDRR
jgi:hypothetical protein